MMEGRERMNPSVKRKCKKKEEKEEFEAAQEKLALMIQVALAREHHDHPALSGHIWRRCAGEPD